MGRLRAVAVLTILACGRQAATVDPLFLRPGDVLCGAGSSEDSCRLACPSGLDCFANGTGPDVCLTPTVACARIGCPSLNECSYLLSTGPLIIGCEVDR